MKNAIIALAIAASATGCKEKVESLPSASIKVEVGNGLGSGTKIGENLILTAAHVVNGQENVKIKNEEGAIVNGRVLFVDKERDLAVVEAEVSAKTAKVKCDIAKPGTEFSVYGNPLGMEFTHSWGRISSKPFKMGDWQSVYTVDSTVIMGQSGGGTFDKYGRLIGVVVGVRLAPVEVSSGVYVPSITGFGFVVDGPTICNFLNEHRLTYKR